MTSKLITMVGTAAPKIAKALLEKGGTPVSAPSGFYLRGGKGPLKESGICRPWPRA
jgi:hypothetical protein